MEAGMNLNELKVWVGKHIKVEKRIQSICVWYLLFLMCTARKHSLQEASRFSEKNKSQFSRFLKNHSGVAVYALDQLSKKAAKRLSNSLKGLGKNALPWKIAILIDSTLQRRSTLHTQNAKRFNHGKGFVIGHQWTNIVLLIQEKTIPLPPIAFHSKKYCRENNLKYKTENESVVEYINHLKLEDYIGPYNSGEVLVLADSAYDDKKIEMAIIEKGYRFIIALNKTRSVKSEKQYCNTPKSRGWISVGELFRTHCRVGWRPVRTFTNSAKRKRMDFRIRQIMGYLRHVGKVRLICSEFKKNPDGRRKYLACNDLKAEARHILVGYRIRWAIEIFHKQVKMHLGFQDVASKSFLAVRAHVHWVYCAYILLHSPPPGFPEHMESLPEKQHKIKDIVGNTEKAHLIQLLTQIKGPERCRIELRRAIQST